MLGTFICFYSCWTAIAIWLILGVVTDWEEEYRLLYDGCGFWAFVAMFAVIWMSFGFAAKKKQFINNIYESMCLNWRRIALYAILLILLSALFVFCLMMPWFVYMGCFLERYASLDYHTYRTAYWITLIMLLLLYTALTYSGVLCAKRISRLIMGNYSGRIVALSTDVLLMAISFVLVIVCERMAHTNLIDILVVLLVVRFLYDLRKPCEDLEKWEKFVTFAEK